MQGSYHSQEVIDKVLACVRDGQTYDVIAKKLRLNRNKVTGIVDRHMPKEERPGEKRKQERTRKRLLPGSLGVLERQLGDKKRITLISIVSLGAVQEAMGYSYTSRKIFL